MSIRYSEDFKKEVVRAYMAGDRLTVELTADYNVAKSTISDWVKKYEEEYQSKHTTSNKEENDSLMTTKIILV